MRSIDLLTYFFSWIFQIIRFHECYDNLLTLLKNYQRQLYILHRSWISEFISVSWSTFTYRNWLINVSKQINLKIVLIEFSWIYNLVENLVEKILFLPCTASIFPVLPISYKKVQFSVLDRKYLFQIIDLRYDQKLSNS